MKKVLIVGPSIERTKGGMATVIENQLKGGVQHDRFRYRYIVSHVEGSVFEKMKYSFSGFLKVLTGSSDIVHIHVASDASFYRKSLIAAAARLRQKPVIMHVHGADFDQFYKTSSSLLKKWIRFTFNRSAKVLVLSSSWADFFSRYIGSNNVDILYNGVDTDHFTQQEVRSENSRNFLFLGRLGQRKGVYDLIEAASLVVKDKSDFKIFLAGDGEVEEVAEVLDKKGMRNHIEILGWLGHEEKSNRLATVGTVVLPSYHEGLPMALIEAMSCGKAIISSRVGGIPELVQHQRNGYLVSPGNVEEIVTALTTVLDRPGDLVAMSDENAQKIKDTFSLKAMNDKLFAIYDACL